MLASTLAPERSPAMFSNSSAGAFSLRVAMIGDGGKLLVGIDRLADALEQPVALDQRDPFAQIAPGDRGRLV